jgi:phage minor structural protein
VITLIKILNQSRQLVAILENAYGISYEKRLNEIWGVSFILPLDDPKNTECQPLNYVDVTDDITGEYLGLYRIVPSQTKKNEAANEVTYECDHVLSTLLDDVLFDYHQNTNLTTRDNIEYILAQQSTQNWRLGTCDFTRYFSYKWEDENGLLGPLFSIAEPFDVQYEWTFDTTVYPWTLNLVAPSTQVACEIRYGKNLAEIERDVDPANIVNRIYPKGYGEGVNQLTIAKVNGGVPYLENADSMAKYGRKAYVWVDRRFEDAASLKASAQALLNEWSTPKVTYRVKAVDLSSITGVDADRLRVGRIVRIVDPDFGTFEARIVSEKKGDIYGAPGDIELEIANKSADLGTTQADIERRQQVNEVYAQGATNLLAYSYNDNADQDNPAEIVFFLPDEMVRLNKLSLWYETVSFRAYEKGAEAGGKTTVTSSSGGGTSSTSSSGGGVSSTTESGGGTSQTSSAGGEHVHKMFSATGFSAASDPNNSVALRCANNQYIYVDSDTAAGIEYYTEGSSGVHSHSYTTPVHSHAFSTPHHSHDFTTPHHSHQVVIENHEHPLIFGIFKLQQKPTAVTIRVDGNLVQYSNISGNDIDLVPYLSKDADGKIARGRHVVSITPDDLGRISAQINTQFFIQSRGNYTL